MLYKTKQVKLFQICGASLGNKAVTEKNWWKKKDKTKTAQTIPMHDEVIIDRFRSENEAEKYI